ncbi:hypothetical protein SHO565_20700 [Streptomyces sp. HO565]
MLTRSDSSPPESAVETTPALPPGGGRRMSGWVFLSYRRRGRRAGLVRGKPIVMHMIIDCV